MYVEINTMHNEFVILPLERSERLWLRARMLEAVLPFGGFDSEVNDLVTCIQRCARRYILLRTRTRMFKAFSTWRRTASDQRLMSDLLMHDAARCIQRFYLSTWNREKINALLRLKNRVMKHKRKKKHKKSIKHSENFMLEC